MTTCVVTSPEPEPSKRRAPGPGEAPVPASTPAPMNPPETTFPARAPPRQSQRGNNPDFGSPGKRIPRFSGASLTYESDMSRIPVRKWTKLFRRAKKSSTIRAVCPLVALSGLQIRTFAGKQARWLREASNSGLV